MASGARLTASILTFYLGFQREFFANLFEIHNIYMRDLVGLSFISIKKGHIIYDRKTEMHDHRFSQTEQTNLDALSPRRSRRILKP